MHNDKATFAIIGKPNNGKSTIISALTFDDRIEIADEIGTTKKSEKYSYKYNGQEVCTYFDTPGFEKANFIWNYIKEQKKSIPSTIQILENFIKEYRDDASHAKDREILDAITKSDFLVFVINISGNFNLDVAGYELKILKELKKRIVIFFNQIEKNKDYSSNWKNELEKCGIDNIHKIDPLNSQYENIVSILESLYHNSKGSKQYHNQLDRVINTFKTHYAENLNKSADLIAEYLKEVLQVEVMMTKEEDKLNKNHNLIQNEIDKKEKKVQKDLSKMWGYHEIKVEDKREKYDHEINKTISLSKKEKARITALIGASIVGTTTGLLSGGFGAPAGAGMGLIGGALLGYFYDGKLYESNLFNKKNVKISVSKNNIDLTIILLTRILEYIKTVISHGHANRNTVIIDKIEKRNFSKDEIKFIADIHKRFVNDEKTHEYLPKLKEFILKIIKEEIGTEQ